MQVLTVGHGTLSADQLGRLLQDAAVRSVVDVRRYPGSRRHPQFARSALEQWLPPLGIAHHWVEALGGRRSPHPDSPNDGLRNVGFRGYADHMAAPEFTGAARRLLATTAESQVAVLCSESLWWRCHRRLIADHLVLVAGIDVGHLLHDGTLALHVVTETAERDGDHVRYPATSGDTPRLAL